MSDPRLIVNYDKEELRKWDARGALLGHPGPSPPFEATSQLTVTPEEDETKFDNTIEDHETQIDDDDFDDHHFGDRVQILDRPKKTGNVCYIVRAVIEEPSDEANRESHYLLIQENRPQCRHKWYLPSGSVFPTESLEEAIIRIVHEEAGITVKPVTVLLIEEIGPFWFRFTFQMKIVEPTEKILKISEDKFSIKSQFWSHEKIKTRRRDLRDEDMLRAVFVAQRVKFRALNQTDPRIANYKWNSLFVEPKGKKYISLRACFVFYNEPDKSHWVIQNKETKALPNIPGWQAIEQKCLHAVVFKFLVRIHDRNNLHWYCYRTEGVTCIEHKKAENPFDPQGLRLTVVFRILLDQAKNIASNHRYPKVKPNEPYEWQRINDGSTKDAARDILGPQSILTPLQSPKLIKIGHCQDEQYQSLLHLDTWHSNPLFSTAHERNFKGKKGP